MVTAAVRTTTTSFHMKPATAMASLFRARFHACLIGFTGKIRAMANGQFGGDLAVEKSILARERRRAMSSARRVTGPMFRPVAAAAGG